MKKLEEITKIYLESLEKGEKVVSESNEPVIGMFGAKNNARSSVNFIGPKDSKFKGYVFKCDIAAYVENDGIGSYGFWGSSGYNVGNDYVESFQLLDYPKSIFRLKDLNEQDDEEYPKNLVPRKIDDIIDLESEMDFRDFCKEIGEDTSNENIKNVADELDTAMVRYDEENDYIVGNELMRNIDKEKGDDCEGYEDPEDPEDFE